MNRILLAISVLVVFPLAANGGKVKVWNHDSPSSHDKANIKHLTLTTDGALRLARQMRPLAEIDVAHVWAIVEDLAGSLYVATGNEGKLFKVDKNGEAKLIYQSDDSQILSLAVARNGTVYAGTGPSGHIIRIAPDGESTVLGKVGPAYVWSLALNDNGDVFAGTGPKGQIYRLSRDGSARVFYATKQEHVLCVAFGSDGQLYAGTAKHGLVYRITPAGKGSVLFNAPQSEVRSLLAATDGIYAGTSSPVSRRSPGSSITGRDRADGAITQASFTPGDRVPASTPTEVRDKTPGAGLTSGGGTASGGSPAPSVPPPSAKENSVYRLAADGTVRELFRDKVMVLSLLQHDGRLLIGTGGDGQLFEVQPNPRQRTELAHLDHTQVHCLCRRHDGSLVVGTGDPGKLYLLENQHVQRGVLTSEPLDAKMLSRWGALRWHADTPAGTNVSFAARSGNVPDPDDTWSDWSDEQTDPQQAVITAPPGRFLQYRATLASENGQATPTLHSVSIRYQGVNVAPEVGTIEVPDYDAVTLENPKKVKIRWTATDGNEDELTYALYYRKDGWTHWVELETDYEKRDYEWDTTTTPAGVYQLRVVASDRQDNPDEEALTGERISNPFIIDHLPPAVGMKVLSTTGDRAVVQATAVDSLTRLVSASYSVDSHKWVTIFPVDGLFDGKSKTFEFKTEALKPGTHVVVLRVTDAAGNTGSTDVVFSTPQR